jgi:FAD/FMN-containing dehydrogenase
MSVTQDQATPRLRDALQPGDSGYDRARCVWNGMIDRRPAVIARCGSVRDVRDALAFAAAERLPVTVRGGGHNVAGLAVADGALLIDLSAMRAVTVDQRERTAVAEGGALLGDLDAVTLPAGLACPTGVVAETGLGGLALGGGYGWLARKWGLTCDHLLWAEVVLADGTVVMADEQVNPGLLWGLRGGGGNFGVVTRFCLRLRPVTDVWHHTAVYPLDAAAAALRAYRDLAAAMPGDLQLNATMKTAPAGGWIPATLAGRPVLVMTGVWAGDPAEGEAASLAWLERLAPPAHRGTRMSFAQLQALGDGTEPAGRRYYTKSCYLAGLTEPAIAVLVAAAGAVPSPFSAIDLGYLLGAIAAVPAEATAFPGRDAPYMCSASAAWDNPAADARNRDWSQKLIADLRPCQHGGSYVNYTQPEPESARDVYGPARYARLARLKAEIDPGNLFRGNHNIEPAGRLSRAGTAGGTECPLCHRTRRESSLPPGTGAGSAGIICASWTRHGTGWSLRCRIRSFAPPMTTHASRACAPCTFRSLPGRSPVRPAWAATRCRFL